MISVNSVFFKSAPLADRWTIARKAYFLQVLDINRGLFFLRTGLHPIIENLIVSHGIAIACSKATLAPVRQVGPFVPQMTQITFAFLGASLNCRKAISVTKTP